LGLDVDALIASKRETGAVSNHADGEARDRDAVIDVDCDLWIPAARPDVMTMENQARLRTRVLAQGANIGVTQAAERALHQRGIFRARVKIKYALGCRIIRAPRIMVWTHSTFQPAS
jgi:glutamate dehydrogenase (NAD(P)+)